jgi:epoxide hydrolase-like predicted phosphatase
MCPERVHTALIVDFGGVLTTPVWESFAAFCREAEIPEDAVKNLFRDDPGALRDLRQLERGRIEEAEFERGFAERLGLDDSTDLIDRMLGSMQPEERMVAAVRAARTSGVRTALLSNSWSVDHYDRELLDELFDVVVISAEVGLHKPQPEIFTLATDRLEVEPQRCVFVDDLRENIGGAEVLGITAVLHRDPEATVARLEGLLGISVP